MKLLILVISLLSVLNVAGAAEPSANISPDKQHKLYQRGPLYKDFGWELCVKSSHGDMSLWRSPRPLKAHWSSDSDWIIIEDYLMRESTSVIVFRNDHEKWSCVYYTPISTSDMSLQFYYKSSELINGKIIIKMQILAKEAPKTRLDYSIELTSKSASIVPLTYFGQPDYGLIEK